LVIMPKRLPKCRQKSKKHTHTQPHKHKHTRAQHNTHTGSTARDIEHIAHSTATKASNLSIAYTV